MKEQILKIQTMKDNGVFQNYIDYIRFPKFKNLEQDTRINLDFPLTFFVGKNGGGKSSTLHALYGAPINYSIGNFWFSTLVDPIEEFKNNRNCFIYGFDNGKEVLKQRSHRKEKPDYWEPSKPVLKYDMLNSKRYSPIQKEVLYVDFRSELSAFDSFMYFHNFKPTKKFRTKQDYIRNYSKYLKKALEKNEIITLFNKRKNDKVKTLSTDELTQITKILDKAYSKVEIIEHNFFKNWGFSIKFYNSDLIYSEAFAGSGETAVIILIHKIHNAPNNSLVLLDEPEVSLHPGAQKRLRHYLLEQIKIKKLQVIISTHSPFFIDKMPSNSIKVFSTNQNGNFHVENEREPKEAFVELEVDDEKHQIIVEDKLAKTIVNSVLKDMGSKINETFSVDYFPGGCDTLKQKIQVYTEYKTMPFVLFDGDQKKIDEHLDFNSLNISESNDILFLERKLEEQTNTKIKYFVDSNDNQQLQKKNTLKALFDFYKSHVYYLPKFIPEEIIWCDEYAKNRMSDFEIKDVEMKLIQIKTGDVKNWFFNLCNLTYEDSSYLSSLHLEFCKKWIREKNDDYNSIIEILNKIRTS